MTPDSLQKAAILISALDTQAADALLDQMGPALADRVRAAVMDLPDVSEDEQQRVIAEFMGRGSEESDVELELSASADQLAAVAAPPVPVKAATTAPVFVNATTRGKRFEFLAQADIGSIARILQKEAPQIAAVVLAHLEASRAAEVLKHLPASFAGEVLFRLANLDDMSEEVLVDLEQQIHAVLSPELRTATEHERGVARLGAILDLLPAATRNSVVAAVANRDQRLAGRLLSAKPIVKVAAISREKADVLPIAKPAPVVPVTPRLPPLEFAFEDLAQLDDAAWSKILQAAEPETILLAFAGAEPRMIDRVLRGLSRKEADQWRKRFAHPGPVRLREIDAAQDSVVRTASDLAADGVIRRPLRRAFAAAA